MSNERVDRIEFGKFAQGLRKSKKLRQADLVDDFLTQPVLSNIENAKGQVSEEKMLYLLKKLEVEQDLSKFYLQESKQDKALLTEELQIKLISIENTIDLVNRDKGLEPAAQTSLSSYHGISKREMLFI